MIAEQMATKLRDAANSVLEMMFMAPVLADQEFPPRDVVGPLLVGLEFAGEAKGSFTLALSTTTAQSLALNFMGMSPCERLERQEVIEVLGELANMLCGHFLGQLNYKDTFRLTTPGEMSLESLPKTGHSYQRTVHLDQGALSIQVQVEE